MGHLQGLADPGEEPGYSGRTNSTATTPEVVQTPDYNAF